MKLDKVHLDRLLEPDTKDNCLFKLNVAERCKRKLQRKRYIEDSIEAGICYICGEEDYMVDIKDTVLCTECNSGRIKELRQPKAAGTKRKPAGK